MIPSADELKQYVKDRKAAAEYFRVTERTVIRWLKYHGLFLRRDNFGPYKLGLDQAREMRQLHAGGETMKDLAARFGVTISAVSRVLHHVTYPDRHDTAGVSVVYNPITGSGPASSAAWPRRK